MDFQPGDLVRLKSGSSLMTVESVGTYPYTDDAAVSCVWTETKSGRQEIMRETFPPVVLEKSEKLERGAVSVGRS